MSDTIKIILFFLLGFGIGLIIIFYPFNEEGNIRNKNYFCDNYKKVLLIEAPETLLPPNASQFISEEFYINARDRYLKYGHWATEEKEMPFTCTF